MAGLFGDCTGNGSYSGLDAQRAARVGVGLDAGLAAYPHIDPLLLADVTGNGGISGLDAQRIALVPVGLDPPEIPRLPQPQRLSAPRVSGAARVPDNESTATAWQVDRNVESVRPTVAAARVRISSVAAALAPGAFRGLVFDALPAAPAVEEMAAQNLPRINDNIWHESHLRDARTVWPDDQPDLSVASFRMGHDAEEEDLGADLVDELFASIEHVV
jgi:hypothetical protein